MADSHLPPDFPVIARVGDVLPISGLTTRQGLRHAVKQGRFPAPVAIGARARGWRRADLETWLANLTPAA